jgi:hypothetical protein
MPLALMRLALMRLALMPLALLSTCAMRKVTHHRPSGQTNQKNGKSTTKSQIGMPGPARFYGSVSTTVFGNAPYRSDYVFERKVNFKQPVGTSSAVWIDLCRRWSLDAEARQILKNDRTNNLDTGKLRSRQFELFKTADGHA